MMQLFTQLFYERRDVEGLSNFSVEDRAKLLEIKVMRVHMVAECLRFFTEMVYQLFVRPKKRTKGGSGAAPPDDAITDNIYFHRLVELFIKLFRDGLLPSEVLEEHGELDVGRPIRASRRRGTTELIWRNIIFQLIDGFTKAEYGNQTS